MKKKKILRSFDLNDNGIGGIYSSKLPISFITQCVGLESFSKFKACLSEAAKDFIGILCHFAGAAQAEQTTSCRRHNTKKHQPAIETHCSTIQQSTERHHQNEALPLPPPPDPNRHHRLRPLLAPISPRSLHSPTPIQHPLPRLRNL